MNVYIIFLFVSVQSIRYYSQQVICDSHCAFVLLAWVNFVNGECGIDSRLLEVLCKIVTAFKQKKCGAGMAQR